MRSSRIVLNLVVVAAAVFLSGCYVASRNVPAGSGPVADERLVGAWEALDEDGKPAKDATFLHFVKASDDGPLILVLVDNRNATNYEMRSVHIGDRTMFAVKPLSSTAKDEKAERDFILGFYDVKGDDLYLNLLDPKKLKDLIDAHQVKGKVEPGNYGKVTLSGSPQELAAFFAKVDPNSIGAGDKPAHARRIGAQH
jgi:hypothetical protein